MRSIQKDLNRKFNSFSARSAHHEWQSANQQYSNAHSIRQDARKLRSQIHEVDQAFKKQFGPRMALLQSSSSLRFARDAPTKAQLAQSAKIYKRILALLQNMIECPVQILEILGQDSAEDEPEATPSEGGSYPEADGGEESDTGYGYQYYN